jgi:hypothetical protein
MGIVPALALAAAVAADSGAGDGPGEAVRAMLRPIVTAPEVTSRVLLERSDPFGGPPNRERGRLWYLPGRGLRYRSEKKNGQDFLVDRSQESFLLYTPGDGVLYRAPFARAPIRLRQLIVEPERILEKDLRAVAERRSIHGVPRAGYRLRPDALGDSVREVVTWIAADPRTGLPRWIAVDSEAESVLVELEDLAVKGSAKARDLVLSAPPGTREEPLDPRELLGEDTRGESR